ncbi:hypothetical protein Nmel_007407 [Mimus melanotis]
MFLFQWIMYEKQGNAKISSLIAVQW